MRFAALALGTCTLAACHDSPHVSGRACIVLDLRYPRQCLGAQDVAGLSVEEVVTARRAVTDSDGSFRIDTPMELVSATLRVAEGRADRRTSLVFVDLAADDDLIVPVIATPVWTSYLTRIGATEDPAHGALHASYEPPGAILASASVVGATEVFYNQGASFEWAPSPPADQAVAIVAPDVTPGTSTVTITKVNDTQVVFDAMPIEAGLITWIDLGTP
jgi:hypothetical protein